MRPLVIFGAGDIAELAEYYFRTEYTCEIAAFTIDSSFIRETQFKNRPLVPFESVENEFPPSAYDLFVAVSYTKLNVLRADKMKEAEAKGYRLASFVSPHAYVWSGFVIEPNIFVLEDNTLQPFCRVGRGATLWSGNHIGHHATIGDYCFVASHSVVSGGVTVGPYSFIGVNATLRDHVTIGSRCVLGAGTVLLNDAPDEAVYGATATEMSKIPSSRLRRI